MTQRLAPSGAPGGHRREEEPVAIVGMAGVYPKAADIRQYWRNILDKVDAVTEAPEDWCGDLFLDPDSDANDRIYTSKGGFLGDLATFDPLARGVMPTSIDGGEPDQFLALEVAAKALADAGFDQRPVPGDRVAVILGRGTYINRGFTTVVQHGIMVDRMLAILKKLHPDTSADELAELKTALKASLPPFNADMAPALVPNLVTGRIANRLDFQGTNYIVDAACASSLIAMERGVADLRAGRCDMAIVGGVHASTPPPIYMIFCQLEALSRAGRIQPFSAEADGTLLAEGVGLLCIKRLSDAEAAGDRIYALVRSVGVASDGKGSSILAPRIEGQLLALRRAYEEADVDPATVGLVEAHGTATSVGDATEVEALSTLFGARRGAAPDCALGSVKSMIGHCLPASGSAGMIKAALALHHKVLPPTLVSTPNPALGIEKTPFYLNTEARPWVHGKDTPRRAGVNAFGFGGINAHAILEEYTGPGANPAPEVTRSSEAIFLDAPDRDLLLAALSEVAGALRAPEADFASIASARSKTLGTGTWRAAVVASDAEDAAAKLDRIAAAIETGKTRLRDWRGVYLSSEPMALEGGKVALMFPGEGSQHAGMLRALMLHFPVMRSWFDLVDGAFVDAGRFMLPSQAIFPEALGDGQGELWRMDLGPEAIFAANQAMFALFKHLGIPADMLVGHSTGEYSALYAAGSTARDTPREVQEEMRALNDVYQRLAAERSVAEGALVALGAVDEAGLMARLDERDDVWLAMDNCPNQKVLATTTEDGAAWAEKLAASLGGIAEILPFRRAYHCPAFAGFSAGLKAFLETLKISVPAVPTYSCLTAAPFPEDPDAIRDLMAAQWSGRVRFVETIEAMYDAGARIFLECGPRNNLVAFTDDILRKRPHVAVASDTPARAGLEQLQNMLAVLAVEGVPFDMEALFPAADPVARAPERKPQVLKMGIQPMSADALPERPRQRREATVSAPAAPQPQAAPAPPVASPPAAPAPAQNPMLDSYFETMRQFLELDREITTRVLGQGGTALAERPVAAAPQPQTALQVQPQQLMPGRFPLLAATEIAADGQRLIAKIAISVADWPYLADHGFGRDISQADPQLAGLSVVPLTFSIEMLAEAAAALRPALQVTALDEVRASRWLALDQPVRQYEAQAEILSETANGARVRVRLREAGAQKLRPILVEAEVQLAATRSAAPAARPMKMGALHQADWSLEDTYSKIMFHGPMLQALQRVDRFGSTGVEGDLVGLDATRLVAGQPAPRFETDAVTLDAVGQLVGVWAAEMLPESFHIFPFRAERIEIFRDVLSPGEMGRCTSEIALLPNDEMRSDIEVVSADGYLQCRITGWWDKRFDLPDRFFAARLDPAGALISALFEGLAADGVAVALLGDVSDDLMAGSGGIWTSVLAGLVLSAEERAEWDALREKAASKRQFDWLRGRVAAKDAARILLGPGLRAADLRIWRADENARPELRSGLSGLGTLPHVSITHAGGQAAGVAADAARYAGVGIDLETVKPVADSFVASAFLPDEQALLAGLDGPAQQLMVTRLWCAKEAAAKSCGVGLSELTSRFVAGPDPADATRLMVRDTTGAGEISVAFCDAIEPGMVLAVAVALRSR